MPPLQDLSFTWDEPSWPLVGLDADVRVRVHTPDNVLVVDQATVTVDSSAESTRVTAGLVAPGGGPQAGQVDLVLEHASARAQLHARASTQDGIRSIAWLLGPVPGRDIVGLREPVAPLNEYGRVFTYPNGWFDLATPFLGLAATDEATTFSARLDGVEPQRIVIRPRVTHGAQAPSNHVELRSERHATERGGEWSAPAWVIERDSDWRAAARRHADHVAAAHPCPAWQERTDVPPWVADIGLVLAMHGRHYTGHVFADYAAALRATQRVAEMFDPTRILLYLPGWEGRYYRTYGRYSPDERLGGHVSFRRLIDGAHDLGMRVMPMFGANHASRDLPGYHEWGQPGELLHASGRPHVGSVDWDASRHHDHGWGALINPASLPWQEHLTEQIGRLWDRYRFDAAFLDISALHANDPQGDTTAGMRALAQRIRRRCPGLLLAGEGWFDAMASALPLVQTGHHHTVPVYHHTTPACAFDRTNRSFGHLCLGDPVTGSTGVHEAGWNTVWRLETHPAVIPTLTVADPDMPLDHPNVKQVLEDARAHSMHAPMSEQEAER